MGFKEACEAARKESIAHRCSQHVNVGSDGEYYVSDWYDCDSTRATYECGIKIT